MDRRSAIGSIMLSMGYMIIGPPALAGSGRLAVMLDDAGNSPSSVKNLETLASAHVPVSVAVLPYFPYEVESLHILSSYHEADIFTHQPMQPQNMTSALQKGLEFTIGSKDAPVHTAIYDYHTPAEAARILALNISHQNIILSVYSSRRVMGFNNHMGSLVTESPDKMEALTSYAKKHGLMVLDSRTSLDSCLYDSARMKGARAFRTYTYLDNTHSKDPHQVLKVCHKKALEGHNLVVIGHIDRKRTVDAICDFAKDNVLYSLSHLR